MTKLERAAVEACNAAGWIAMGVGDGSGQLLVYGPVDAIQRAQQLALLRPWLHDLQPEVVENLLETLRTAEKAIHLDPVDEASLEVLKHLLLACAGKAQLSRSWEQVAKEDMGLQVLRPSPHQVQFRLNGVVRADWWPGKGTTLADNERGPICKTGEEVIEWLRLL